MPPDPAASRCSRLAAAQHQDDQDDDHDEDDGSDTDVHERFSLSSTTPGEGVLDPAAQFSPD
jgi:hypothetical protein